MKAIGSRVPAGDTPLPITNRDADRRFRDLAIHTSLDPDDRWVGGYVDYEWRHSRHLLDNGSRPVAGKAVLEFGCNLGATAITLAALGASVTAVDVNARYLALAQLNAERYGLADGIEFIHVADSSRLPFSDGAFDVVYCNSVLEYVSPQLLGPVQKEIDRVLKPGGLVIVLGTSNRIWPREVHSRRWLANYLPRAADTLLAPQGPHNRGAWPWRMRFGFGRYDDLNLVDGGRTFAAAKARIGLSPRRLRLILLAHRWLSLFGISIGMVLPSMYLVLRKCPPVTAGQTIAPVHDPTDPIVEVAAGDLRPPNPRRRPRRSLVSERV